MELSYLILPFFAWLLAGSLKFVINSLKARRLAFDLIGYGGMPSNHSAIVASIAVFIWLQEGSVQPAFGVAVALAFIVILDAHSLRRQIGRQAEIINALLAERTRQLNGVSSLDSRRSSATESFVDNPLTLCRTRIGHSRLEIIVGVIVGAVSALLMQAMTAFLA